MGFGLELTKNHASKGDYLRLVTRTLSKLKRNLRANWKVSLAYRFTPFRKTFCPQCCREEYDEVAKKEHIHSVPDQ